MMLKGNLLDYLLCMIGEHAGMHVTARRVPSAFEAPNTKASNFTFLSI